MSRGGARPRSGPSPDLEAFARERDKGEWVLLPMSWDDPAPEWPLNNPVDLENGHPLYDHDREQELWEKLWSQGQAPAWLLDSQEFAVALYVRLLTVVESSIGVKSAPLLAEMRRQQEMLGLSADGLAKNKWRFRDKDSMTVAADESAAKPSEGSVSAPGVIDMFAGVKVRGA